MVNKNWNNGLVNIRILLESKTYIPEWALLYRNKVLIFGAAGMTRTDADHVITMIQWPICATIIFYWHFVLKVKVELIPLIFYVYVLLSAVTLQEVYTCRGIPLSHTWEAAKLLAAPGLWPSRKSHSRKVSPRQSNKFNITFTVTSGNYILIIINITIIIVIITLIMGQVAQATRHLATGSTNRFRSRAWRCWYFSSLLLVQTDPGLLTKWVQERSRDRDSRA